jgi:hypothetical protein
MTLVYAGKTYEDYLLFAEPQIIDGKEYQLYNQRRKRWTAGGHDRNG